MNWRPTQELELYIEIDTNNSDITNLERGLDVCGAVDISSYTKSKQQMLACHKSQLQRGVDVIFLRWIN